MGRWFWAKRAAFSFIDDESMVFWRLKLLLLQMKMANLKKRGNNTARFHAYTYIVDRSELPVVVVVVPPLFPMEF